MYTTILSLLSVSITYTIPTSPEPQLLEISERPTSPNYHSELKDFFGTANTLSENSSEDTLQEHGNRKSNISICVQLTLAKFSIQLFGTETFKEEHRLFVIELEDIITSIDQQDVYTKIKTKFGSLSGVCKTRKMGSMEWQKNDVLGLITSRSDSLGSSTLQDTFFDLTITKALTKNVHNKWGTLKRKKNQSLINTITEIMINIQSIDIKLDLEMLSTFLPIFMVFSTGTSTISKSKSQTAVLSVSDLPLIFFQSKGIQIFVPLLSTNSTQCNVMFLKVYRMSY